jgi:hypothetical protein
MGEGGNIGEILGADSGDHSANGDAESKASHDPGNVISLES